MGSGHGGWVGKALAAVVVSLVAVSIVAAQAQPGPNRGRIRNQGGAPLKKARPEAGDPLAKADGADAKGKAKAAGAGTYHYTFKLHSFDGSPLAASFYPSKLGSTAPVVMLVHEANRSRKDFEEPVSRAQGARAGRAPARGRLCCLQHGPSRSGPEPQAGTECQRPSPFSRGSSGGLCVSARPA